MDREDIDLPSGSHAMSEDDREDLLQSLSVVPILRGPASSSILAPTSPPPSQPLSSYKLSIVSSKKLRKMNTAASSNHRLSVQTPRTTKVVPTPLQDLGINKSLTFPHLATPSAALLATGVNDGRVLGTPGRALGLLYGPSNSDLSAADRQPAPLSRSTTQRQAQAVLLIGSAESSPVLRILPRLLEMPLLASLQSREGEPLVMELLLRGLSDEQVETFEWFVAVVRLFAAKHQCVPLIEEVV